MIPTAVSRSWGLRALWLCVVLSSALLSATNVVRLTAAEGASSFDGSVASVVEEIMDQLGTAPGVTAALSMAQNESALLEEGNEDGDADLGKERVSNVQKALGGLTDRQAQALLGLLQEYVDTNREILERLDALETKHEDELRSLEESGDESVLELFGEAVRKLVLHRFAQPTDPECHFNYRKMACEPFCHCRFELRFGDHSPTHACRLSRGEQQGDYGYSDEEPGSSRSEALPTCPVEEEPLDVSVRLRFLLRRVVRFLRANVWLKLKAQASRIDWVH